MDERSLTERDICARFILPAIRKAGWDSALVHVREECCFIKGRITIRGKLVTCGNAKKADVVLYYKPNVQIALIEVKYGNHRGGDGMQQGPEYVEAPKIPFVLLSNRERFVFNERTGMGDVKEQSLTLDRFPSPAEFWSRHCAWQGRGGGARKMVLQDYYDDGSGNTPSKALRPRIAHNLVGVG